MLHLMRIACAYFGLKAYDAKLNELKRSLLAKLEVLRNNLQLREECQEQTRFFSDKPFNTEWASSQFNGILKSLDLIFYIISSSSVSVEGVQEMCAKVSLVDKAEKGLILEGTDAINSALNVQFKVDFAIEHLKKIARAYIGFIVMEEKSNEELKMIDGIVRKIEVPEDYLREAKYFWGKPLSTGLFH
ncbi:hypothetical protein REPUB_Repub08aG0215700 [Reevesia pubescens]